MSGEAPPKGESDLKLNLTITGMTCATCAKTVEKALMKLPQVKFASVNLATNTAFIVLKEPVSLSEVAKAVNRVGYGVSERPPEEEEIKRHKDVKKRFLLGLTFTAPLMFFMILHMCGVHIPYFTVLEAVLGLFVILVAGFSTLKGAFIAVSHLHANMDTLISLGSIVSVLNSFLKIAGLPIESFGTVGAMIITLHLAGRYIESSLRDKAVKEVKALLALRPREAKAIIGNEEVTVPVSALKKNMVVIVKPGERIPADGRIVDGTGSIDESMITGESTPVHREVGDSVIGGTINLNGKLLIIVEKEAEDSMIASMVKLMEEVQGTRIPIQKIADRITNYFVPVVVILAILSFFFWYFKFYSLQGFLARFKNYFPWILDTNSRISFALFASTSTIVIACPCAVGLAIPMALLRGAILSSGKGILIKNAEVIQTVLEVKFALFDKTGTLTLGKPVVVHHNLQDEDLSRVVAVEKLSTHPLGFAIASLSKMGEAKVEDFIEKAGEGVEATVDGVRYSVGKPEKPELYREHFLLGRSVVEVKKDGNAVGYFVVEDALREDSQEAVRSLWDRGITPVLVTGDNKHIAEIVARKLNISYVHGEVTPKGKVDWVHYYKVLGGKVLMVGDGINDGPALKAADISVTISQGSDLAIENADVVIVKGGISKLVDLLDLSGIIFRKIKQNLLWAFCYNVVAIPLAVLGLVNPIIAEIAMSISSISVILNSLRLK